MKIESQVIERRYTSGVVEVRSASEKDSKRTVRGYAAKYGKTSNNLGSDREQVYEIIERGAFDDVLSNDVRALFNHDSNLILARSKGDGSGTLKIGSDDIGLWYEFEIPDTTYGRDLAVSIERGDVDQSSFAFTLTKEGQSWEQKSESGNTVYTRIIKRVSALYDVSPVTYPAYNDASVGLRSLEDARKTGFVTQDEATKFSHNSTGLIGALVGFF